nr:MAG TPA: hypothetical protein [Caudoviricetes sp.]
MKVERFRSHYSSAAEYNQSVWNKNVPPREKQWSSGSSRMKKLI